MLGRILGRLDVNAVGRTGRRAQEAGNTLLQAVLIPLQHMRAAEAILKVSAAVGARSIRVVLHLGRVQHLAKRDAHSLRHSGYVAHNGHRTSIRGYLRSLEAKRIQMIPVNSSKADKGLGCGTSGLVEMSQKQNPHYQRDDSGYSEQE